MSPSDHQLASASAALNDNLHPLRWKRPGTVIHVTTEPLRGSESTPAWYLPATGDVYIGLPALAFGDPVVVNDTVKAIRDASDFHELPNYVQGMLAHETAHSAWTTWLDKVPKGTKRVVQSVAIMFEELRIEKRACDQGGAEFLRGAFQWLLASMGKTEEPDTRPLAIAHQWALCFGRYLTGSATYEEISPVDTAARAILGDKVIWRLRDILDEAVELDHRRVFPRLLELAQEWLDAIGHPEEDETTITVMLVCSAAEKDEDGESCEAASAGDGDEGETGEGEEDERGHGKTPPVDREAADLMERSLTAVGEHLDRPKPPTPPAMSDPRHLVGVFSKKPAHYTDRPPTPQERARATALARTLEQLSLPSISKVSVPSEVPPGRLRGREMVRQGADRAAGRMTAATPWERSKRTRTTTKPIVVGVMTDTSGSMGWAVNFVAEFAWIVARAGIHIGARTAAVTFGDGVDVVIAPGQVPQMVRMYPADGGTEMFDKAAAALDGALHLSVPNGAAKILFIVSDGHLVEDEFETARANEWIRRFRLGGTSVVWLAASYPADYPGAMHVERKTGDSPATGRSHDFAPMYRDLEGLILRAARGGNL